MNIILIFGISALLSGMIIRIIWCFSDGIYDDDGSNIISSLFSYSGICFILLFLIKIHSFIIIPLVLYFIIGYIVSLKLYSIIDAPEEFRKGCLSVGLVMEIIAYYPIILIYKFFIHGKMNKKLFIKTPFSEYEKYKERKK